MLAWDASTHAYANLYTKQEGSEQTLWVCTLNTLWRRPEYGCLCLVLMAKQKAYKLCSISVSFGAAKLNKTQLIYNFLRLQIWDSELIWQEISSFYNLGTWKNVCFGKKKIEKGVLNCFLVWRWRRGWSLEWNPSLSQSLSNLQNKYKVGCNKELLLLQMTVDNLQQW